MLEATINSYGKDKLKNLATYSKFAHYPILHKWVDLHSVEPKKFIMYFAMPDDIGNTFVIPAKWCENIRETATDYQMMFKLNESALLQLGKVGNFTDEFLYPIIHTWEDLNTKEPTKKKFNIFYAILNSDKKTFMVQSTWGEVILRDELGTFVYTAI